MEVTEVASSMGHSLRCRPVLSLHPLTPEGSQWPWREDAQAAPRRGPRGEEQVSTALTTI